MIEEGEQAPGFELPGIRGGEPGTVDAGAIFGGGIVVLAFYPGDFNPACSMTQTDLDELDLFTMQKDVTVLAISGDSVHSHRAFAEEYSLEMALLSDLRGEVAAEYGVAVEDESAGHLTKRAVFVVDHTGTVQYAWATDDLEALPDVDEIRDAVKGIGDDDAAESRYRVGHARYMEGRRAFTSAMNAYEDEEWMMAKTDFGQAAEEFDAATEEFNTAVRFSESEETVVYFDRAEAKSEALSRASEWLSQSAGAYASGSGRKAESLRSDAEEPLRTIKELHEPPDPDDFPPEEDPAERVDGEPDRDWLDDEEEVDTTLDADIDAEMAADEEQSDPAAGDEPASGTADGGPPSGSVDDGPASATADDGAATAAATAAGADDEDDEGEPAIDDAELEEITAELEQQTEATPTESDPEPGGGNVVPQDIEAGEEPPVATSSGEGDEQAAETVDGPTDGQDAESADGPAVGRDGESADGPAEEHKAASADGTADESGPDTAAVEEAPGDSADEHVDAGDDQAGGDGTANEEDGDGAGDDEEIELDLTDPTEGGDEEDDEDEEEELSGDEAMGGGDHGVPDSL